MLSNNNNNSEENNVNEYDANLDAEFLERRIEILNEKARQKILKNNKRKKHHLSFLDLVGS